MAGPIAQAQYILTNDHDHGLTFDEILWRLIYDWKNAADDFEQLADNGDSGMLTDPEQLWRIRDAVCRDWRGILWLADQLLSYGNIQGAHAFRWLEHLGIERGVAS